MQATIESLPDIITSLLDSHDPKKVRQMVIQGYENKIKNMRKAHAELVKSLSENTEISHEERFEKLSNSDGKIRSMCWFTENLS